MNKASETFNTTATRIRSSGSRFTKNDRGKGSAIVEIEIWDTSCQDSFQSSAGP
jgi:hypothetical protein